MPSTQLPLTPVAPDCLSLVRTAIQHVSQLTVQWPDAVMVACWGLPQIKAAHRKMDQAALAGDLASTKEYARTFYRVWKRELEKHPKMQKA